MIRLQGWYLKFLSIFMLLASLLVSSDALAWNHAVTAGVGYGPERGESYNNAGVFVDYMFYRPRIDKKLVFFLDSSAAVWRAGYPDNRYLEAFAVSGGFRAFFVDKGYFYRPFLQIAVGPAYLTSRKFGNKEQGTKFNFQDRLGVGMEFGSQKKTIVVLLEHIHYSNAGIKRPNPGFEFPFVLSIGYAF